MDDKVRVITYFDHPNVYLSSVTIFAFKKNYITYCKCEKIDKGKKTYKQVRIWKCQSVVTIIDV